MVKIINHRELEEFYDYLDDGTVNFTFNDYMYYTYIIGTADEIKPIYRSMVKACERGVFNPRPYYLDFPKFNSAKFYGIEISWNGIEPYDTGTNDDATFTIIGEHTIVDLLLDYYDWSQKLQSQI